MMISTAFCLATIFTIGGTQKLFDIKISDIIQGEEGETCAKHIKYTLEGQKSRKLWAQMMFDSMQRMPPSGLMSGRRHIIGRYDECVQINPDTKDFEAQFCLMEINIPLVHKYYTFPADDPFDVTFYYATCLPSTCTAQILNGSFNKVVTRFVEPFNDISVNVDQRYCHVLNEGANLNFDSWIVLFVISFCSISIIVATFLVELKKHGNSPWIKAFSLLENWSNVQREFYPQLPFINGISALALMWIIWATYSRILITAPIVNSQVLYELMTDAQYLVVNNAQFGEDTLLLTAGLIIAYKFLQKLDKNGYDHPKTVIKKYIQWTIPFGFMIFFVTSLMRQCGSGATWDLQVDKLEIPCRKHWWQSLLYVQNYFKNWCLRHTWLLSVQMQLFWISPIVLLPVLWSPTISVLFSLSLALLSAAVAFYSGYQNDLGPTYNFTRKPGHFVLDSIPTHTRACPWFLGVCLGIVLYQMKDRKLIISKGNQLLVWILTFLLLSGAFFSLMFFDRNYTQPFSALTLALNRFSWSAGISLIILLCAKGYAEPLDIFLSWRFFHFINRLNLCLYISHEMVITYHTGLTRELEHFTMFRMWSFFSALYILSTFVGLILHLLIYLPCKNIVDEFFKSKEILPISRGKAPIPEAKNGVITERF